jgi:uncharacterized protein
MNWLTLGGYFSCLLMGAILGLVGAGGSILTVPILIYLFAMAPWLATSHSLPIVGLTALGGALAAFKRQELNLKVALLFGIPGVLGVAFTRAYWRPSMPEIVHLAGWEIPRGTLVLLVFVLVMMSASFSMLRAPERATPDVSTKRHQFLLLIKGFAIGTLAGFVGAGGGFLIIPVLVHGVGLPMRTAVGTSLMIIAMQSLLGVLGGTQETLNWGLVALLSALALVGMYVGTQFRGRIPQKVLRQSFGAFVFLMGIFILLQELKRGN